MANRFINLHISHKRTLLWILAFVITLGSAVFQRMTGPTHPVRTRVEVDGQACSSKLLRTMTVNKDVPVTIDAADHSVTGFVMWRRYKSNDEWARISLKREEGTLSAFLPHQPPAGKLMYLVYLEKESSRVSLTADDPVILRYKGDVPSVVLIIHVFFMFFAMVLSNRTGLEALDEKGKAWTFMLWTVGFFIIGGFIFGPLVQKYAFGALWTGVPFGTDLTDNKVLIAMLGWVVALVTNWKKRESRGWIFFAAVLMLVIYLIPHSLLGSELDYTKMPQFTE
jgi:hypothetical protein